MAVPAGYAFFVVYEFVVPIEVALGDEAGLGVVASFNAGIAFGAVCGDSLGVVIRFPGVVAGFVLLALHDGVAACCHDRVLVLIHIRDLADSCYGVIQGVDAPGADVGRGGVALRVEVILIIPGDLSGVGQIVVIEDAGVAVRVDRGSAVRAEPGFPCQEGKSAVFSADAVGVLHRRGIVVFVEILLQGDLIAAGVFPRDNLAAFRTRDRGAVGAEVTGLDGPVIVVIGLEGGRNGYVFGGALVDIPHDVGPGFLVLADELMAAPAVHDRRISVLVRVGFEEDPSGVRVGHLPGGEALLVIDGLVILVQIFLEGDAAHVVIGDHVIGVGRAIRDHAQGLRVQIGLGGHVAQVVVGIADGGIAHGGVCQVAGAVVVVDLGDVSNVVVGRGLCRKVPGAHGGLPGLVEVGGFGLPAGEVIFVPDLVVVVPVGDRVAVCVEVFNAQHLAVRIDLPGQAGVEIRPVDRGRALGCPEVLLGAEVPVVVDIGDFAVAAAGPGQLQILVVIGQAGLVVGVVIFIAQGAVAAGEGGAVAVAVQIFPEGEAVPVVPGVPDRGEALGVGHRGIVQIQEGVRQDVARLVHGAALGGVACADVGPGVGIVQIEDPGQILIVVIGEFRGGVAILRDGGLTGGVQIGRAPDVALIGILIADASVAGGDDDREAREVQIGFADLPVVRIVGVDDGAVAHLGFHGLHAGVQVLEADHVALRVVFPAAGGGPVGQGGDALLLIQILLQDHVVVGVVFPLPDGEALRQADQLVVRALIADLQGVARVVIDIGDGAVAFAGQGAGAGGVEIGLLGLAAPAVIGILDGGIALVGHDDIVHEPPGFLRQIAAGVILAGDPVVAARHLRGLALKDEPGLLDAAAVGVVGIGDVGIGLLLEDIVTVRAVIGFGQPAAVDVEGLDLAGVAGVGDDGIVFRVVGGLVQQVAGEVVGADLQGVALRRDGGGAGAVEVFLPGQVAQEIVFIGHGGVFAPEHEGSAGLVEIGFGQEAAFVVEAALDFRRAGLDLGQAAGRVVIHLAGDVSVLVVFQDVAGVTLGAEDGLALRVHVGFLRQAALVVIFPADLMVAVGADRGLRLGAEIGFAELPVRGVPGEGLGAVAEGGLGVFAFLVQIGLEDHVAVAVILPIENGVAVAVQDQIAVGVIMGFLEHVALQVQGAAEPGVAHGRGNHRIAGRVIIGPGQEVAAGVIVLLIAGVAGGEQGGRVGGVQIVDPFQISGHGIIGHGPGAVALRQGRGPEIRAVEGFADHVMILVVLADDLGVAAHQGGLVDGVEVGDGSDVSGSVVAVDHGGVSAAQHQGLAVGSVIFLGNQMAGEVIGVDLGGVLTAGVDQLPFRVLGHLPEELAHGAVFPNDGGIAHVAVEGVAVRVEIPGGRALQVAVVGVGHLVGAVDDGGVGGAVRGEEAFLQQEVLLRAAVDHGAGVGAVHVLRRDVELVEIGLMDRGLLHVIAFILIGDGGVLELVVADGVPGLVHVGGLDNLVGFVVFVDESGVAGLEGDEFQVRAVALFPLDLRGHDDPVLGAVLFHTAAAVLPDFPAAPAVLAHRIFVEGVIVRDPPVPLLADLLAVVFIFHHGDAGGGHGPQAVGAEVALEVDQGCGSVVFKGDFGVAAQHLDQLAVRA